MGHAGAVRADHAGGRFLIGQGVIHACEIDAVFNAAAEGAFKGLIEIDNDKRVSSDFIGSTYSSTYVPDMTSVVDGTTVKVLAWYENEWGYSSRLVDMTVLIGTR